MKVLLMSDFRLRYHMVRTCFQDYPLGLGKKKRKRIYAQAQWELVSFNHVNEGKGFSPGSLIYRLGELAKVTFY